MRLVCGLGNPEKKFLRTRHNVGFRFLDALASSVEIEPVFANNFDASIFISKKLNAIFAKPLTSMNASGSAVSKLASFYKITPSDIYVIHDDLDILLGSYKIQKGIGPKDHNGILSIERLLGSKDFWRVRIGIENRKQENRISGEDYVLEKFTAQEEDVLEEVEADCIPELKKIIS